MKKYYVALIVMLASHFVRAQYFGAVTNINVGAGPVRVIVFDINLDGKPDLITANQNSNNISIRLGDGAGNFTGSKTIAAGGGPSGAQAADVNLDGFPDILVSNFADNTVSVLLADGAGNFTPVSSVGVGAAPSGLQVIDMNTDGNPDILTVNQNGDNVSVCMGDGTGGFSGPSTISVGSNPYNIFVVDINLDGKRDFVTANLIDNSVSVRLGDGLGGFVTRPDVPAGAFPTDVFVADVSGDSFPDLVISNLSGSSVAVRLGAGDGTFTGSASIAVGGAPRSIYLADINFDSKPDLFSANGVDGTVSVRLGDGAGGFSGSDFIVTGTTAKSVVVTDINADGKPDLLCANFGDNNVSVALNIFVPFALANFIPGIGLPGDDVYINGAGLTTGDQVKFNGIDAVIKSASLTQLLVTVPPSATTGKITVTFNATTLTSVNNFIIAAPLIYQPKVDYTVGLSPREIKVADFDGDGHLDLATSNAGDATISILHGSGNGCFVSSSSLSADPHELGSAAADLNGDGKPDFVTANQSSSTVSVFLNSANGFLPPVAYATAQGSITLAIGDVDNDGLPDLIVANDDFAGSISVLINAGSGTFKAPINYAAGSLPYSVTLGDIDGDNFLDVAVANPFDNTATVFKNDKSGGFPSGKVYSTNSFTNIVLLRDLNKDGLPELILSNAGSDNAVGVMINDGTGNFLPKNQFRVNSPGDTPNSIVAADMNNDGNLDIVAGNQSGSASVLLGDGRGSLAGGQNFATGAGSYDVIIGDVDEDGFQDIVTANYNAQSVSVLKTSSKLCSVVVTHAPVVADTLTKITANGTASVDLDPLISDEDDDLDLSTLKIIAQPESGATATISADGTLTIDYSGIIFSGTDHVTIEVCDHAGNCTTHVIAIDVEPEITIYNAVSANGDGKNEIFYIAYIDAVPDTKFNKVTIYNRWGDSVFETSDYDNVNRVFTGKNKNGDDLPVGIYFYKIAFNQGAKSRTGFLSLKR